MAVSVGVPAEVKLREARVAVTPAGCRSLVSAGIVVLVEASAGSGSGFNDEEYRAAGATIVSDAAAAWAADFVVKVKEPQTHEFAYLRRDLTLFTYLHLAAYPNVARALIESGCTAIAYETIRDAHGGTPLLAPMSEVAGRLAPQVGARFLEQSSGGRGVLLSGVPGVRSGRVVVIGAGSVGWNAAQIAAGLRAETLVLDTSVERLRQLAAEAHGLGVQLELANQEATAAAVREADLVIGAVLVPGDRSPVVVDDEMVRSMRPGSVIVDVAVDQGGCVATTVETSHDDPVRTVHGVVHYAVGNMPGIVPNTSTRALTNVTLPFVHELLAAPFDDLPVGPGRVASGCNVRHGSVVDKVVQGSLRGAIGSAA
jgi:alanine dehydrogenase